MRNLALVPALSVAGFALCLSTPARAEIPPPVRSMINAAIESGDVDQVTTVIALARKTNPDDTVELDAILAQFTENQMRLAAAKARAEEDAVRKAGLLDNWSGTGQIGASHSSGNSSNTGLTAGLALKREGINWRHKLNAVADYQRSNGVTTAEQYLASYEPNYKINERLYAYGLGQWERDRYQGFSSRYTVSGGLGYIVINDPAVHLEVKAGPAWRKTQFVGGGSESSLAGLAAMDFSWAIADNIAFTQNASAYLQSGNKTFISATGLEAGLSDSLKARISYTVEHDTDPPAGAKKTDTLSRFTLVYGF